MATCPTCRGTKVCQKCKGDVNRKCSCGQWDGLAGVNRGNAGQCPTCKGRGTT